MVTTFSATSTCVAWFAEADDVAGARIGVGLAMGHPHAAADDHIVADDLAALLDRDETEIVRENIDIVMRRQRNGDLELARHVGAAVDRLVFLDPPGDLLLLQPDFMPGAAVRQQMRGDVAVRVH